MPLLYHIFKKGDRVLIVFGRNISDTTRHQMTVQFPISPSVCTALPGEKNQQNVAFLSKTVLLLNQNHTQKPILSTFSLL